MLKKKKKKKKENHYVCCVENGLLRNKTGRKCSQVSFIWLALSSKMKQRSKSGKFLIKTKFLASVRLSQGLAFLCSQHGDHLLMISDHCLSRRGSLPVPTQLSFYPRPAYFFFFTNISCLNHIAIWVGDFWSFFLPSSKKFSSLTPIYSNFFSFSPQVHRMT